MHPQQQHGKWVVERLVHGLCHGDVWLLHPKQSTQQPLNAGDGDVPCCRGLELWVEVKRTLRAVHGLCSTSTSTILGRCHGGRGGGGARLAAGSVNCCCYCCCCCCCFVERPLLPENTLSSAVLSLAVPVLARSSLSCMLPSPLPVPPRISSSLAC